MALSKKTVNKHNLKRAEVFAKHGLGNHDVRYAHPAFQGYGDAECILCGKQNLKWLFAIRFDAPDMTVALGKVATGLVRTDEVTLAVVGSKCITDWLDAVPHSIEKLEALKRWDAEMEKMKDAKKKKVCEDLCAELAEARGIEIAEGMTAREAIFTLGFQQTGWNARQVIPWQERKRFTKTASKIRFGTCVRKTAQTWIGNLELVLDRQAELDAAKAAQEPKTTETTPDTPDDADPAAEQLDDDLLSMKHPGDAELIMRGRKAWIEWDRDEDPERINDWERSAFTDIGKKVVKYHSFVSNSQRGLYAKILAKLEKTTVEDESEAPVTVGAVPGASNYTSLSEISGARY